MKRIAIIITLIFIICSPSFGDNADNESLVFDRLIEKAQNDQKRAFIANHVPYKNVDTLPKAGQQIVFCQNDSMMWLELENFEFLINSKLSRQLIVAYVGIHNGQKIDADLVSKQKNVKRKVVPIYDPESTYVFQNEIVVYWNQSDVGKLSLEKALEKGFDALDHHFDAIDKADNNEESCIDIRSFIDERARRYNDQQEKLNRLFTLEKIKEYESLGFVSYYPNPYHLNDMAWLSRPEGISYNQYIEMVSKEGELEFGGLWWDRDEVNPFSDDGRYTVYEDQDEYSSYFEQMIEERREDSQKAGAFYKPRRLSGYFFRGHNYDLSEVYKESGIWNLNIKTVGKEYGCDISDKACRKNIVKDFTRSHNYRGHYVCPHLTKDQPVHISTTKFLNVARAYGHVYLFKLKGGFEYSFEFGNNFHYESAMAEVLAQIHISWNDIIGFRENAYVERGSVNIKGAVWLFGPVFLRDDLEGGPFWQALDVYGGKPQYLNHERKIKTFKICKDLYTKKLNEKEFCSKKRALRFDDENFDIACDELTDLEHVITDCAPSNNNLEDDWHICNMILEYGSELLMPIERRR